MSAPLRLLASVAHPDDESLGVGGTLARYAREGIETYLITATRGQKGRYGLAEERPPEDVVARTREAEVRAAAAILGVREVTLLDYVDGELDRADPVEAAGAIAAVLRRVRPHVVLTFAPDGGYGHPDHIAISQFTAAAVVRAAAPDGDASGLPPHAVSKLYYMAWTQRKWAPYEAAFKVLRSKVDGVERQAVAWPEWQITTEIDTEAVWETVWAAVQCHRTQLPGYKNLASISAEHHRNLWGSQEFYRVFSIVNGGRQRERDLFEGLRS
ncbi:MAG: PIG-L deacetylase family protein [Hyphomicrobiales bacterium]